MPQHTDSAFLKARPICASVDLEAITHNVSLLRRRAGRPVRFIAPIKANAYGHGVVEVAKHLSSIGVDALATASLQDALDIRKAGVSTQILMFGSQLPSGVSTLLKNDLTPTIYNLEGALAVSSEATSPVHVHVKVDAGLGRLGVKLANAKDFIGEVLALPNLVIEGVYTHVPFGDAAGEAWSRGRLVEFNGFIEEVEREYGIEIKFAQASASATMSCNLPDRLNTISPGHLMFGLSPVSEGLADLSSFRKALTNVTAKLIHIADHDTKGGGAGGSYGLPAAKRTGVILLGMDNGFRMPLDPDAFLLCNGVECKVLSVTAEYTVIDISDLKDVNIGDDVTIVGSNGDRELTIEQLSAFLGAPSAAYYMVDIRNIPIIYKR